MQLFANRQMNAYIDPAIYFYEYYEEQRTEPCVEDAIDAIQELTLRKRWRSFNTVADLSRSLAAS
jgi:hypothetical protein